MHDLIIITPTDPPETRSMIEANSVLLDAAQRFIDKYVAKGNASPNTRRLYSTHLKTFLRWAWENQVNPLTATEETLLDYRAWLYNTPQDSAKGKPFSNPTVRFKIIVVRMLYKAAQAFGIRADDPSHRLDAAANPTPQHARIKYLNHDQSDALLNHFNINTVIGARDFAMVSLMIDQGLRISEVQKLTLEDIAQMHEGTIEIRESKGNKTRLITPSTDTVKALDNWLKMRDQFASPTVFIGLSSSYSGNKLSTVSIRNTVNEALVACGLKREGISAHALRHTFATLSLDAGASLDSLQDELGHSDPKTTRIYAKVLNRRRNNPAQKLADQRRNRREAE